MNPEFRAGTASISLTDDSNITGMGGWNMKRQVGAALLAVFAASCGGGSPTEVAAGSDEVVIQGFAFNPSPRRIEAGTAVTWTNRDGEAHTTTGGSGENAWDSGLLAADRSFSRTFTVPGTYQYTCTIHPEMKGTIIVE